MTQPELVTDRDHLGNCSKQQHRLDDPSHAYLTTHQKNLKPLRICIIKPLNTHNAWRISQSLRGSPLIFFSHFVQSFVQLTDTIQIFRASRRCMYSFSIPKNNKECGCDTHLYLNSVLNDVTNPTDCIPYKLRWRYSQSVQLSLRIRWKLSPRCKQLQFSFVAM